MAKAMTLGCGLFTGLKAHASTKTRAATGDASPALTKRAFTHRRRFARAIEMRFYPH
jgi:hypothetical protein